MSSTSATESAVIVQANPFGEVYHTDSHTAFTASPHNKKQSPWGKKTTLYSTPPSLAAIQMQEEQERLDAELARRLQEAEKYTGPPLSFSTTENENFAANLHENTDESPHSMQCEAATPEEVTLHDEELARKLQEEENCRENTHKSSSASHEDTSQDHMLALLLQQQFHEEHEDELDLKEKLQNKTPSKLNISMNLHRTHPSHRLPDAHAYTEEEEEHEWEDPVEIGVRYDRKVRSFRDSDGVIVTKHNKTESERKNRQRMETLFPIGFNCGDLRGAKRLEQDVRINNKVYNQLRRFAEKDAKQTARVHEKKEHSTAVMAMDKRTRVLVFKMINKGDLLEVDGAISTGKESVVFHGSRAPSQLDTSDNVDDDLLDTDEHPVEEHDVVEVALKVFKTTLTEFTQRQQFLHGDRRYERCVGRQHARKLVRLWAEKERANLIRLARAGIPCPHVFLQRQHILVMSFLGRKGKPAPKLKDVNWERKPPHLLSQCYQQVCDNIKTMFDVCNLVHCDLSEYNVLWFNRQAHIIDVGQSVEKGHPRALAYLYRDCENISRYFERTGCPDVMCPEALYEHITGVAITAERGREAVQHISILATRDASDAEVNDSSDILLRSNVLSLAELQNMLLTVGDEDEDEEGDEDEDRDKNSDDGNTEESCANLNVDVKGATIDKAVGEITTKE